MKLEQVNWLFFQIVKLFRKKGLYEYIIYYLVLKERQVRKNQKVLVLESMKYEVEMIDVLKILGFLEGKIRKGFFFEIKGKKYLRKFLGFIKKESYIMVQFLEVVF